MRIEVWQDKERKSIECVDYPGGEMGVTIPRLVPPYPARVVARVQDHADLVRLLMVSEVVLRHCPSSTLTIPYFPYARQDRVTRFGEAFSLKVLARLVNALGYKSVRTFDPHSDVTPALVDRLSVEPAWSILEHFQSLHGYRYLPYCALVAPDAGAEKKVRECAKVLSLPCVTASKVRDTRTGALSGFRVHDDVPEHAIIVDDICDGGGTFVGLAKILRERGARNVDLYVTHGIFSKGLDVFDGLIDNVYTTNTFLSPAIVAGRSNLFVKAVV